ncbi:MAG: hypothetical protein IJR89_05400 [Clostridia bacterium]|nr:hypothetical protein [Clostridia bacterium]
MTAIKKKVIVGIFSALIFLTILCFIVSAIHTYRDELKQDDMLEGLGAALLLVAGGFVVLYECDLFYTLYYFLIKPKTKAKTVLNVLANLSFISMFAFCFLSNVYMGLRKFEFALLVLFAVYVVVRMIYLVVSGAQKDPNQPTV